jgi:hypothetical protein
MSRGKNILMICIIMLTFLVILTGCDKTGEPVMKRQNTSNKLVWVVEGSQIGANKDSEVLKSLNGAVSKDSPEKEQE